METTTVTMSLWRGPAPEGTTSAKHRGWTIWDIQWSKVYDTTPVHERSMVASRFDRIETLWGEDEQGRQVLTPLLGKNFDCHCPAEYYNCAHRVVAYTAIRADIDTIQDFPSGLVDGIESLGYSVGQKI